MASFCYRSLRFQGREHMSHPLTPEAILAHPRFAEARLAHLDALTRLFKSDRFTSRLMIDAGMIMLRGFLVGFHVIFDVNDRATWATPSNIRHALLSRNLASARRIDDLLARFRQAGYVVQESSPGDRRTKIFLPTGRLLAHDRDHLAAYHTFLLELTPGRGYEWTLSKQEHVHAALRRAGMRNQSKALSALQHEALRPFLARDAGYLALLLVAQAQLSGSDDLTWTSLSEDLGVSRSHLKSLFSEAETAGYVQLLAGRRRPIEILPPLWAAYDRFLAEVEADQDLLAQQTFRDLD